MLLFYIITPDAAFVKLLAFYYFLPDESWNWIMFYPTLVARRNSCCFVEFTLPGDISPHFCLEDLLLLSIMAGESIKSSSFPSVTPFMLE